MRRSRIRPIVRIAAIIGIFSGGWAQSAQPARITLYDKDPNHPWNRAYAALMARAPEPDAAANDLLDPPFYYNTQRLLDGESNREALALLREIADGELRPDRMSPLQRAVMQRDLLGIFHWLVDRYPDGELPSARRALGEALARAIRSVALTKEEILKLPDNYAAALAAPGAVTEFDAAKPGAYLPKDLLAEDGAWLTLKVKGEDRIAGMLHFQMFRGRSTFEVRMRHPEGRAAGEAYLKQLADMPHPKVSERPASFEGIVSIEHNNREPWPNPATPQFPPGTTWALIRRAVLADTHGKPITSPLVESVQIRVYRVIEPNPLTGQTFFEWESRRSLLLGKGGFHLTTPADEALGRGLFDQQDDAFERKEKSENRQVPATLSCVGCHFGPGIHSVMSRSRALGFGAPLARPPEFVALDRVEFKGRTEGQANQFPSWVLLRWLWPSAEGR